MFDQSILESLLSWQIFLIAGIILMLLEICLPAFFLLWVGVACLCTAGIQYVANFTALGQIICFSSCTFFSLIIGFFFYSRKSSENQYTGPSDLNNKTKQMLGEEFVLAAAISASQSDEKFFKIINDTRWAVQSNHDIPIESNTHVRVVSIKGNTLIVEPL